MDKRFNKCRLCLKLGDFCSIFECDESIKLSEMVMSFANVQIFENDGFSDRVCNTCIENLSTAYLFKQQCEKIDDFLKKTYEPQPEQYTTANDYNGLLDKDINIPKNATNLQDDNKENVFHNHNIPALGRINEVSSETDSDVESVKCVYCNSSYSNWGGHKCHVTCTIEKEQLQRASSSETLVASDYNTCLEESQGREFNTCLEDSQPAEFKTCLEDSPEQKEVEVSCVLCDDKYADYEAYVLHFNRCTANVKLQHYVCPICHEIFTEKSKYLKHLDITHFKTEPAIKVTSEDCVDTFAPALEKVRRPTAVRRQIGWSIEDIYQEIDCKPLNDKVAATPSPIKNFFSKLGNESFSRQSTPKRVSFRKIIEDGKTKTASYFRSFRKKSETYSPLKGKKQVVSQLRAEIVSDSDYNSPSGTSEESWKMKQNLICACDKKVFMLSESLHDRDRIVSMISEMGGVVAENTKMEMLATHFIAVLPSDTFTGMMVCALATGKWLLHVNFVYDSFRGRRFMEENLYEWKKHPKILELDNTSVEVAKAAVYWHLELQALSAKFPFEGKTIVLVMKKKYRQYYHMIFKALKAKPMSYDPRTPGSCCTADYCFVDMKVIERVKLRFFARHNVPVFPYQYILVYLLSRGNVHDEHKYVLQDNKRVSYFEQDEFFNNTY